MKRRVGKSLAVATALMRSPRDIARYARQTAGRHLTALDSGLPWIPFAGIRFLESYLQPHHEVLELGGGGSTVYFAERARRVVTLENDSEWARRIETSLRAKDLDNVELRYGKALQDAEELPESDFVKLLPEEHFDLILIDFSDFQTFECRPVLFGLVEGLVKTDGVILVDDFHRYPQLLSSNRAKHIQTLSGVGPSRRAVSSIAVFYY